MESQHPGIIEQIMRFENAELPNCTHCVSENTADVQVGIIGRTIYIATATTKFQLITNGPDQGDISAINAGNSLTFDITPQYAESYRLDIKTESKSRKY